MVRANILVPVLLSALAVAVAAQSQGPPAERAPTRVPLEFGVAPGLYRESVLLYRPEIQKEIALTEPQKVRIQQVEKELERLHDRLTQEFRNKAQAYRK